MFRACELGLARQDELREDKSRRLRKEHSMPSAWFLRVALLACSLLAVLILSNVSWAAPKGTTYYSCKCTCQWEDELGKEHFGPSGAVQFTESSFGACLGHTCTTTTPTGTHSGLTRDCAVTEHTQAINVPGNLPTLQPQTPVPGQMPLPSGTIRRRGVEEEQQPTPSEGK